MSEYWFVQQQAPAPLNLVSGTGLTYLASSSRFSPMSCFWAACVVPLYSSSLFILSWVSSRLLCKDSTVDSRFLFSRANLSLKYINCQNEYLWVEMAKYDYLYMIYRVLAKQTSNHFRGKNRSFLSGLVELCLIYFTSPNVSKYCSHANLVPRVSLGREEERFWERGCNHAINEVMCLGHKAT